MGLDWDGPDGIIGRRLESKSVLVDEITSTNGNWRNRVSL